MGINNHDQESVSSLLCAPVSDADAQLVWQIIDSIPSFFFSELAKHELSRICRGESRSLDYLEREKVKDVVRAEHYQKAHVVMQILRARGVFPAEESSSEPESIETPSAPASSQGAKSVHYQILEEFDKARIHLAGDPEKLAHEIISICHRHLSDQEAEEKILLYFKRHELRDPRITPALSRADKPNRGRKEREPQVRVIPARRIFMPAILVNGILPACDPDPTRQDMDKLIWTRRDGQRTIVIASGQWKNPETGKNEFAGVPYGKIARLLMLEITSQALLKKTRVIEVADTIHGMVKSLGMSWGGKTSGDIRNQVTRLFASIISVDYSNGPDEDIVEDIKVSRKRHLLWERNEEQDPMAQGSTITLSQEFFDEISRRSVPLVAEAARNLLLGTKSSGFEFDVYTVLTKRCYRHPLQTPDKTVITWEDFADQVGCGFSRMRDFRRRAQKAFEVITRETCWPEAKDFIFFEKKGIVISWKDGARPHVAPAPIRKDAGQ